MDDNTNTTAVESLKPGWGLLPPLGAVAAWGARAIYTPAGLSISPTRYTRNGYPLHERTKSGRISRAKPKKLPAQIDLLWDRQGTAGNERDVSRLCHWLDRYALPKLRKECALSPSGHETLEIIEGNFTLVASTKASYGYLYIGAWVQS